MSSQDSNDNLKNLPLMTEDKKQNASSLKLAPIPTTSPWKSTSLDSTTAFPVEGLTDIAKPSKPNKISSGSIRLTSNTKWTPITPSLTITGSKDVNSSLGRNAKNAKNNKKMKKHGKNNNNSNKIVSNDRAVAVSESRGTSATASTSFNNNSKKATMNSNPEVASASNDQKTTNGKGSSDGRKSKNWQNRNVKTRHNNENHNSMHNKTAHYDNSFSNSHQSRHGYTPNAGRWLNNNFRPGYNQQSHFHPSQNYNIYNYQPQLPVPYYYEIEPIVKSIESIKNQIEFYFSEENLKNDEFLKSKFSKTNDGFIPMALIGKFYRMVNLSLGGNLSLILAAMREILNNNETNNLEIAFGSTESTPEGASFEYNPLDNYFIRCINWSDYITANYSDESEKYRIEKILEIGDLDNYSFMGYPSFSPSNVNVNGKKKNQTHDGSEMSREFEQNLQIND
ncbi:slf1p [Saccharomyces arboricola H-6]|uniref:Slf1p n=1 Tax=Saccharomyces arboricola (strain H-6 / AS 2.3317 / CBS 10644) TaxID=1160507 RepID=J8PJ66_SACAR|nr:slf1p [Saccharomyces arboricola H-6]